MLEGDIQWRQDRGRAVAILSSVVSIGGPYCSHRWAEPWRGWGSELCGALQAEGTARAKFLRHEGPHLSKEGPGGGNWGRWGAVGEKIRAMREGVPCQPLPGRDLSLPSWARAHHRRWPSFSKWLPYDRIDRAWESKHCWWFLLYIKPRLGSYFKNPLLFISMCSRSDCNPVTSALLSCCN